MRANDARPKEWGSSPYLSQCAPGDDGVRLAEMCGHTHKLLGALCAGTKLSAVERVVQ